MSKSKDIFDVSVYDAQGVIVDLLEKLGGPNGREWLLATKRFLRKEQPRFVLERIPLTLTVNYGQGIEEALKAGCYDWTHRNLTSQKFPPIWEGTKDICVHLVHFYETLDSDEVSQELNKLRLRDATIEELLALGANPVTQDLQRRFSIVARGSVWQSPYDLCYVPVLRHFNNERHADLFFYSKRWNAAYRFLAASR